MSIIVDIGCAVHKRAGTVGIDCRALPGVDVVCDFERGLPFKMCEEMTATLEVVNP